jgi:circadian clock protein KaiC
MTATPPVPPATGATDPPALPRVATGILGLDEVSQGGLPRGRVTVVAGPAGSAKTVLAGQFLASGAHAGEPGVFVTLEESEADLRRNLTTLGLDIAALEESGDWEFVDAAVRYDPSHDETMPVRIDTLAARIGQAIDRTGATRIVIDSYGAAGFDTDDRRGRLRLRALLSDLRRMGATVVLTVETGATVRGELPGSGVEEFVADTVILLRNSMEGEGRRRTLEILKMRGAPHRLGQVPFTILSGRGMVVLPVPTQRLDRKAPDARVTSGNSAVDELCGGGFFRDSIVLVSGATGTGKTLMVTEFIAGGVARGEKSLLVAFDETHDQLRRNVRGWGYDFDGAEADGLLRVVSTYPEVATLEDHLVAIKLAIDEFGPGRIAVDSLSALERAGSATSLRGFIIGLTAYVKAKQVVGLFTVATDTLLSGSSVTESHISTLTDTIILLRYVEVFGALKRGMTVLKMRGSAHDRDIREYRIDGAGLHVGDPFRTVAGILSGNIVSLVPTDPPPQ